MLDLLIFLVDDPTPEPTEVKAGPLAFAIWIFMILAVAAIGYFLVKQLRRAQANKDAGMFGDEPVDRSAPAEADRADTDRADTDRADTDRADTEQ